MDGHGVSETEKAFLMNWKAMLKARRRQQKRTLQQIPYISEKLSEQLSSDAAIIPAPPLTLPALPARQLPRRNKKCSHHETSFSHMQEKLPQLVNHEEVQPTREVDDFKLPELVPYQSMIAQQGHVVNTLSNHHCLKSHGGQLKL